MQVTELIFHRIMTFGKLEVSSLWGTRIEHLPISGNLVPYTLSTIHSMKFMRKSYPYSKPERERERERERSERVVRNMGKRFRLTGLCIAIAGDRTA